MELKLINSQNDSGAVAPHIVRVWQGTTLVLEHYAVPDATGTVTQKIVTLPAAVYDIEVVNPNLFESRITPVMLFYNPANNFGQEELQTPRRNILACQSEKYSFDGSQIVNLTVETANIGINNTNILYTTVGTLPSTSGNDLDGNPIASGGSIPSVLTFQKISDNSISAMTLPNKKMWLSTAGTVDASAYVPYIAATIGIVSTNPTPVIEADSNNPDTSIRWNTPSGTGGSLSTKTVELYDGNTIVSTINFTGTTNLWENLASGAYKIRYTTSSNSQPFSAFSNVVVLGSVASDVPFVTVVDATLNSAGTAEIRLSGVTGATIKVFLGGLYATSGIVDNNSRVYFTVAEAGNYTFTQLEAGKTESAATAITTIGPYAVVTPSCNLNGTFTISDINYSAGILTYAVNAANFGSARWRILQGTNLITNGLTGTPAGTGNPQISVGTIPGGNYTFDVTGLSCVGTTSGSFTVANGDGGTLQIMDYDLGTFEACNVPPASIEFGSSATNDINTVTDWIQGTRITKDINLVADSTFFWIRDKNNHAVVSPVFQKT